MDLRRLLSCRGNGYEQNEKLTGTFRVKYHEREAVIGILDIRGYKIPMIFDIGVISVMGRYLKILSSKVGSEKIRLCNCKEMHWLKIRSTTRSSPK